MALTAVEKIISAHADHQVQAGDVTVATVDCIMAQDGNAPLVIHLLREEFGGDSVFDPSKVILVIDHCAPSPTEGSANMQCVMRTFASATGIRLYDAGFGISHVVLPEQGHAAPGQLVVGSDSHSVTYGAVNCLGTGLGATDIAVAMYTGKVLLRVPETIRIILRGTLPSSASAKDLALEIVRTIGVDGATYKCLEIHGPGLDSIDMDGRFTVCSMAVEMGGKCVLMPMDDICDQYVRAHGADSTGSVWSDPGCSYEAEVEIDLDRLVPLVALPHDLTRIVPASAIRDQTINMAFIGTCTNSRISDLKAAAAILKGRQIHPNVRLIVTPGSRGVYLEALRLGLIDIFVEAGAMVTTPGCGACIGTHQGVPGDGEVVISSMNRNFKGRMGNRNASIFLASPSTVVASALSGHVSIVTELEVYQ